MEYKLKEKLHGKPESEENFRFLSSFAQDAIIQINERGLIAYWNKSAERLFGLSEVEVLNKSFHLLFAPERYLKAHQEGFTKFRNSGQGAAIGKTLELEGKRKNGEEFPIELSLSSFQVNGEWNAVGIIRDITKHKKIEQKLRDSEEKLQTLFDNVNDAIYVLDLKGNFIDVNATACKRLGYEKREFLQMHIRDINAPELIAENPQLVDEKLWLGKDVVETVHVTKSGKKIPVEIHGKQSLYQNEPVIIAVSRDITKRKIAENQLKESEKKYKNLSKELELILDNIPALIFYKDTKNNFIRVNKYIADAYNMKKEGLIGKNIFELHSRKVAQAYLDDDLEVITSGKSKLHYVEKWETADGLRWSLTSKIPLIDVDGKVTGIIGTSIDITERKKAEEKLRESEIKFRNIINNLDVGFYQVTLDGKVLNHNPTYNKILGLDISENLKNTKVTNFWEKPELREEYLQQLLRDDFVKNYICQVIKKDGSKIVLQLNSHLIRDKEGKPIRIDGTFIDVTEKFSLEVKLKRTLETTIKVLETLSMGIILVDNDKKIQSVNKVALSLLGYDDEFEILGKNWNEITCPAENNASPIIDRGKERNQTEIYLKDRSGNEVSVLTSVLPITLDDVDYLMEAFVDITSLKEIQNQLKESQEKYLDLIETSTLGILEINLIENKIEYANPAISDIIECSLNDIKTENLFFKMVHPEDISLLMSSHEKRDVEFRILLRDGRTKWIAATRLYTYGIKQQPINLRLWLIDITERKKNERLKEKFTEYLEREVEYRTKDLKDLLEKQRLYLDQIEKSSRFKTEFLATMSHELRTPLNAIIGFTDLLIEGVFGGLNKEQIEYIKDIDDSSKNLLDMITDILDISKIESGLATLKIEEIQLNNMIDQVISTLKPSYSKKDIKWELAGLKREQFIFADRIKFKQIIYNLLSNAIKFTEKGKVIFEFKENKKEWEFVVKDTGIGISEKDYDIIFKDFKRVKSDYVDVTQGTGLGLALTKRLINIHGGDISFSSKLEKGTTFTFNLPKSLKEKSTDVKNVESFLNKL